MKSQKQISLPWKKGRQPQLVAYKDRCSTNELLDDISPIDRLYYKSNETLHSLYNQREQLNNRVDTLSLLIDHSDDQWGRLQRVLNEHWLLVSIIFTFATIGIISFIGAFSYWIYLLFQ